VLLWHMAVVPGPRALRRNIHFLHHRFTPVFLFLIGVRLHVQGKERIDPNRAYIIVANHRSAIDFILNARAFPGVFRFLAKKELLSIPVFGWVVGKMCLIVDRSSQSSRAKSMALLVDQLDAGWSIFIYPEGRRNRGSEPLAPFYDGAFRIATQTGAPLLIQTTLDVHRVSATAKAADLWPGVVRITWDGPIETRGVDIQTLKNFTRQIMKTRLAEADPPPS
ncbi:MAG: lysophospholipid acyltransferase family protein, partial [Saprospiraceae bacterium]